MAGWLKNTHFEDRRNNFQSTLFPEAAWFGGKLFLLYMMSLQSHPIILLPGWIKLFLNAKGWGVGRGKNIIWKQKALQNNYNILTTPTFWHQLFIAWISLLLFLDANHVQVSIKKIKDFKKSKWRTLLSQWSYCLKLHKGVSGLLSSIQIPKHLHEKFWLPSASCFLKRWAAAKGNTS